MNRITMSFLVLAATGGCMAVDPDPIYEDPLASAKRLPAQTQTQAWTYAPKSTAVAKTNPNGSASATTVAASKPSSSQPSASKADNTLVKTAYSETKPQNEGPAETEIPPVNLGMLRLTNSKRVTFHYEIKDAALIGAAGLEIWGTTDMRTWKKYDTTTRSPSSLSVEVKDEGLYGFTMIARDKGETAKSQPPSAEPPQVWVAVDLTKPVVQLLGAELKTQAGTPSLLIRWSAKDRNFGSRPITLLYAERVDGPWRPIAANLENSGRYEGPLPPNLPASMHVRVQAADLMGNLGTTQPTTLLLPGPSSARAARAPRSAVSILSVDDE
ncbi:MAG TPA: hypothetical protein VMF69_21715 [Gemmataceae bacterium]|nr:hypothetical protein [Gemmataceae bacterium]